MRRLTQTNACVLIALALSSSAPLPAAAQRAPSAPEAASGFEPKVLATAKRAMISAANPLAVEAGLGVLDAGGTAIDAAIAVQMVLNLVEPQSSGIGGGAFLLHADARGRVRSYDGRETAPAAAKPERFLKADGTPRAFPEAVFGGESVGVPGVLRMLEAAHKTHGKLPWSTLFAPAIKLAEDGFAVSPRLNKLLVDLGTPAFEATARAYFFAEDGKAHPVGHLLKNPAFAATLKAIAGSGADALHKGPIAEAIVAAVQNAPNHKGDLSLDDLAGYKPMERAPLCVPYRAYRVCGMGPPSSGGIAIAQMLKLVEPYSLGRRPLNPDALHLLSEAQKLAYADRDKYVADPDHVKVPAGLIDPKYLEARRTWIDRDKAKPKAEAGEPPGQGDKRAGLDATVESIGTSHVSIIDARGNAVALTTTIENAFGARIMAAGFLLNNELTDFSFRARDANGNAIANAVGPGKRPRSSMAPTIILDRAGKVKAVLGSPGGSRIILYVAKAAVGIMDWGLDAQAAADLANVGSRNGPLELEAGMVDALTIASMTKRGHQVQPVEMTSGLHIIVRRLDGTLEGGADPRREGLAKGR